jgi:hypothetical protein
MSHEEFAAGVLMLSMPCLYVAQGLSQWGPWYPVSTTGAYQLVSVADGFAIAFYFLAGVVPTVMFFIPPVPSVQAKASEVVWWSLLFLAPSAIASLCSPYVYATMPNPFTVFTGYNVNNTVTPCSFSSNNVTGCPDVLNRNTAMAFYTILLAAALGYVGSWRRFQNWNAKEPGPVDNLYYLGFGIMLFIIGFISRNAPLWETINQPQLNYYVNLFALATLGLTCVTGAMWLFAVGIPIMAMTCGLGVCVATCGMVNGELGSRVEGKL